MDLLERITDGRTDLIVDYIRGGGGASDHNKSRQSLLVLAAYYGDVTAIKYLIQYGERLDNLGRNFDLNGAAFHGHWQLCQYLLEQGASANQALGSTGETPLHSCLSKANNPRTLHIVHLLLAHGANPNARTLYRKETGGFMRDAFTHGETPMHRAAAFGTVDIITALIQAGGDKTIKDMNGDSPLSWASWHLRPGKILALLAHGPHTVHPLHEERIVSDHGAGYGAGTMHGILGTPHIS